MVSDRGYRRVSVGYSQYISRVAACRVWIVIGWVALIARPSLANDPPAKSASPTHDLAFRAGTVTVEGPMSTLTLCQAVEVTVHRYRITAEQLTLQRTPSGVLVKGPGLVAFCPCETTPISVGFSEAKVAPPTDLLIENAVVRVGGVPVFYTPVLWLRSPNRIGILSPHFGWRAQDGFWMGSGLHLPLKPSIVAGDSHVLDVTAGGYVRGGWDAGIQLTTPRTTTQIRLDHVQTTFIDMDARGSQQFARNSLSWSADLLKGPRARTGFVSAEAASRQSDRARIELTHSDGGLVVGAGLRWEAWRAAALTSTGLVGPQLRLAAGTPIDKFGQMESNTSIFAWSSGRQQSSVLAAHSADLGLDARPSVFATRLALHERFTYTNSQPQNLRASIAGAETRLSLPLVKSWGNGNGIWSHWLEPFSKVSAAFVSDGLDGPASSYRTEAAQIGLNNLVGRGGSDTAYQLEMRAGVVSSAQVQTTAFAVRSRGTGRWLLVGADAVVSKNKSWLASSRIRFGDPRLATLSLRVDGRTARSISQSRWFTDEAWVPWLRSWESRGGWTSTSETSLSPTEWLAVNGGIGADITAERTLFDFASIGYRHPCGCLAISATVSERLGRSGWDAWAMVDLMPH